MSYRDESKNFFFDVKVSTPDGKKSARLTDTIMRMCAKADIMEAIASEQLGEGASSLTLTFMEADLLPDDLNKTPAEGVEGRGYITNRTGALIDLRFDSEKGFTYVTPEELESGYTQSSRTQSAKSEPVAFMFSHNNEIEITWGHLEPKVSRKRKFKIGTVNYSTGASGNTLTIQAYTLQQDLGKLQLNEGKAFVDKQGQAKSIKQALYDISAVFGARLMFDGELVNRPPGVRPDNFILDRSQVGGDTLPTTEGTPLYLTRNQKMDDWIKELANKYNSTYEVYDDPFTGEPVIDFSAESLRFKKVIRSINYRDPKGVMLEFQFNTIAGEVDKSSAASAIGDDSVASAEYQAVRMTDGRSEGTQPKAFDTTSGADYNSRANDILERDLNGASITTPSDSVSSVGAAAFNSTNERSFLGFITVKVVGHPDFRPDVMKIEGVGVRASTTYRFFQVQHSLSASGYVCTMQGKTQESVEQGVDNLDELKQNEDYVVARLTDGR